MFGYRDSLSALTLVLTLQFAPAAILAAGGKAAVGNSDFAAETESARVNQTSSTATNLAIQVETALQEIRGLEEQIKEIRVLYKDSAGEARERAWIQLQKHEAAIDEELDKIVDYFHEMKTEGMDTTALESNVKDYLLKDQQLLFIGIDAIVERFKEQLERRENSDAKDKLKGLQDSRETVDNLHLLFKRMSNNAKRKQLLGLDPLEDLEKLDSLLTQWADELSVILELVNKEKSAVELSYNRAVEGEKESLKLELNEIQDRQALVVASLDKTIEMMKKRKLATSEYSKLLITSTGRITQDLFQKDVAVGLLSEWVDNVQEWIIENAPSIFFQAIVIFLILIGFRFLAAIVSRVINRGLNKANLRVSHLFREFAISTSRKAVMLFGVLVALSQMGIDVGPMLAGLGVAGFVVGFALKDTLSNFASGMMILIYRPFDVGDAVEVDGVVGKVKAMTLVSTTVLTFDNQQLMIPNNNIWGNTIKNITARKIRRVDMIFGIGYGDDIAKAEAILWKIVKEHPLVLEEPETVIKVSALSASSVDFVVRPWSNTADYWNVYWDVTRSVKEEFDKSGVTIPFPQSDVHLYRHGSENSGPATESSRIS